MAEVIVTRGGQITLPKRIRDKLRIREGDTIMVNAMGEGAFVSKRDPAAFDKRDFLPEHFGKVLADMRKFSHIERLRKLGIIP